jgi:hypothetical protein
MIRFSQRGRPAIPLALSSFFFTAILLLSSLMITACSKETGDETTSPATTVPLSGETAVPVTEVPDAPPPTPTNTAIPPSPTPQLAALVNGQPILLTTFEKELARYEMAQEELGQTPGADGHEYRLLVLDALIERELIRQAANAAGISIAPDQVEEKIANLSRTASESGSFDEWLAGNKWTLEEFREALAAEMLVEAMVASITADVPYTGEQIRASYIQLDDKTLADSLLMQLKEGADFAELAARYSRDFVTAEAGGDLGYFARGSLLVPEVEDAAYQLSPGEISAVISVPDEQSGAPRHYIIKVTERDHDRPLNTTLRHQLLQERYDSWLDGQWGKADIVHLLEGG